MRNASKVKVFIITLLIIIALFAGFFWYMYSKVSGMKMPQQALPAVTVSKAVAAVWPEQIEVTGNLVAQKGITVAPEAAGRVTQILFHSGQHIEAGTPLVILNPDVLQAQLAQYQAELKLSQVNFKRDQDLYRKKVKSKSELDQALATLRQDEAMVAKAKAQFDQMTIRAPFSGKLGLRKVSIGDYVSPGQAIVNLQAQDPMFVDFNIPSRYLNDLTLGNHVSVASAVNGSQAINGKVFAVDASVDTNTQTLAVRASIPNQDGKLVPGSYANVTVDLNGKQQVLVLPQLAVMYAVSGDSVYRVEKNIAKQVYVKIGQRQGNNIAILSGIKAGDTIITSGQLKVRNNSAVNVVPDLKTTS